MSNGNWEPITVVLTWPEVCRMLAEHVAKRVAAPEGEYKTQTDARIRTRADSAEIIEVKVTILGPAK